MKDCFQNGIERFIDLYPNFKKRDVSEHGVALNGIIDIADIKGNLWSAYEIEIIVHKKGFPNVIPFVFEISNNIERDEDWHISPGGLCCLDITHNLILLQKKGINLITFYQEKIYPFFANHTYRLQTSHYANGDYPHEFEGVKHFYAHDLGIEDREFTIELLTSIIQRKLPGRNSYCICGKGKYKKCHLPIVEKLIKFGYTQLMDDLEQFKKDV